MVRFKHSNPVASLGNTMKQAVVFILLVLMITPFTGSIVASPSNDTWIETDSSGLYWQRFDWSNTIPEQAIPPWLLETTPWWERTTLDLNRNHIHDSLEGEVRETGIGLSYAVPVTPSHLEQLNQAGFNVVDVIEAVNAVLLGVLSTESLDQLSALEDVVMVEEYGVVVFYGDVQTPTVKARNSTFYPVGAWDLGVSGEGVNIAMVDTGVDHEHPGLNQKFVAGYDAVCYLHSDPQCVLAGGRVTDGSFDPDDGNQHGTACMGMASSTGLDASGAQTDFYGSAPDASLVDVRIGTDAGAGPFENYLLSQEFYESAMNGLQWIIDNKDTAWEGADETRYGIDIISLSWGITSHEGGGSDGEDMHSRILNEAMEAGVVVSVAAGNDGPSNDGLSGMGSSNLAITVGATDDLNTIDRSDDTIASYSSRGPRRDNGDGNPLNELKPEVSAPGTNIIQAEGCVTQGTCNNFLGGDASENGYTGRGSGTSYATPSVSGILALMIEMNPDLSTAEMKEILKLTAERRGEPTQPEVDPFWNRDFGWGMVDAYEAVKLAQYLGQHDLTGVVDVYSQVHITSVIPSDTSTLVEIQGMAWGQEKSIASIEVRIDNGAWKEVAYEVTSDELGALERFNWSIGIDAGGLAKGEHTIEVRAINSEGVQSLPVFTTMTGTGDGLAGDDNFTTPQILALVALVLVLLILVVFVLGREDEPLSLDALHGEVFEDAILLDESPTPSNQSKSKAKKSD